jgi:DNA-binding XRE family transcriptional regulator
LTAEKRRRLRGEGESGEGYVEASKVQEQVEERVKNTKRQTRDELINDIYTNSDDMTQAELADAVGLSRSRIADILSQ